MLFLVNAVSQTEIWAKIPEGMTYSAALEVVDIVLAGKDVSVSGEALPGAQLEKYTALLQGASYGLLLVGILVGVIGVSNAVNMSVTAREREFGLRRALGVAKSGIVAEVLFEVFLLSFTGALLGVSAGLFAGNIGVYAVAKSSTSFSYSGGYPLQFVAVLLLSVVAMGLIVAAGSARAAAKVSPVTALRAV